MMSKSKATDGSGKDPDVKLSSYEEVCRPCKINLRRNDVAVAMAQLPKNPPPLSETRIYEGFCRDHNMAPIPFVLEYAKRTEERERKSLYEANKAYQQNPTNENWEKMIDRRNAFPSSFSLDKCHRNPHKKYKSK